VLKNLLANAFKFTEKGSVTVQVGRATRGWDPDNASLRRAREVLALAVHDTGIGIEAREAGDHLRGVPAGRGRHQPPLRRHRARARDQPRDLALLGGELRLESSPGAAACSRSTCRSSRRTRCRRCGRSSGPGARPARAAAAARGGRSRDRGGGRPRAAVVEDDPGFAQVMADLGRERGFKIVVAARGADAQASAPSCTPTRSPSTWGCLTSTAGACSTGSRTTPRPATSRCSWSRPRKSSSAAGAAARSAYVAKPAERGQLAEAFGRLRELVEQPRRLLVLEGDARGRTEILS
jgi:hypothetical protein